jgi:predicted Zn finger-like uncharacterized protein
MIVDCHSCGATYNISDEKIRGRRVRVRCKSCNEGIIVDGTQLESDEATRVFSPNLQPAPYTRGVHDEATRVMAPSGPDLRAAASDDEWTVNVEGSDQRNMDLAELVSSYTGGLIPDDALVWREGMDDWLPVKEVPEIQAAVESTEATHVVSPAIAVRAPRRASGDRGGGGAVRRAEAEPPPRAQQMSLSDISEPPPRARQASLHNVPAPPPARSGHIDRSATIASGPANDRSVAAARVREGRAGGADLFGSAAQAGGEEALLGSSALSQYDDKPIGARNESSVLFSLDALKAGARRGSSAPPQSPSRAHHQTAADILGLTAGGALPGMGTSNALFSAPPVDAPLSAFSTEPPARSKMDTLPPMRARRSMAVPIAVVLGALVVGGTALYMVRARMTTPPPVAQEAAEPAKAEPTTTVAKSPEPPPAETAAAAPEALVAAATEATPEAHAAPTHAPQGDGVTAPIMPSKPSSPSTSSKLEAMKAAMRPDKPEASPKPDKGAEKVVLAEESSGDNGEEKAEEPPKPPFDTGSAKTALASASSSAASCKKDDGPTGTGKVQVTFAPTGRATSATVIEGPFGGTSVGGCVAKLFRAARVPAFSGDPVTVSKSFTIPE